MFKGIVEADETYPSRAAMLWVGHESLNRSMGKRVRVDPHVRTVNSRHSRLKDFLPRRRRHQVTHTIHKLSLV